MAYFFNTPEDQKQMLEAIGAGSVGELFSSIPDSLRLDRQLDIAPAQSELELTRHMSQLAAANAHADTHTCFMGAGSYDHFIPAVVDTLASRGEFYTSYTPYQPEVSQGNLQVMFEYQTLICELTGMDVSNASLYDGGSSVSEAALMCMAVSRRHGNVVVPDTLHPEYRHILETYLKNIGATLITIPTAQGLVTAEDIEPHLNDETACVVIQYPNFFGSIEDVQRIGEAVHSAGALLVVSCDPIALGLLKRPGDLGADIVVAEGQSLGTPMQFGGPYLGIIACREKFVRRMPGRIAGETTDRRGRRCWVLTLQTREQHIRRDKATSNICTNQGLFALRACIYLSVMGPKGLKQAAYQSLQKANYAAQQITANDRFELAFKNPFFKEFVIRDTCGNVKQLLASAQTNGILAGVPLDRWYPDLGNCFLVAVTEKRTRSDIDQLVAQLANDTVLESNHA